MKKTSLLLLLLSSIFFISSCGSENCGCTYPVELSFLKSWRLLYTDINGKQVPSDKKEIITLDSFQKTVPIYTKEIDDSVVEKTFIDSIKETSSSNRNEVVVTFTLDKVIYKQKLRLLDFVTGQPQNLIATAKIKADENFGDFTLHYEFYKD
ncbi:hypothetical protein VB776_13260 [Arcicella sp. DC2W]|uniref:Lipoprotein n=1 Tax=Arcicella gelida TaxID=2984195 RepID=A0ABU5S634_9BACT|nr:hypothetical protein [Arcicella sp. DC2W]MEA5403890.1 hypothetical protein [Arcicella sp. DC2W]